MNDAALAATPAAASNTERADALRALLARVEACREYDRALDAEVVAALEGGEVVWTQARYTMEMHPSIKRLSRMHASGFSQEMVPAVTWSLDAAMGLAIRTLNPRNVIANLAGQPRASIVVQPGEGTHFTAEGDLGLPVAIVAATLKAHIARLTEPAYAPPEASAPAA